MRNRLVVFGVLIVVTGSVVLAVRSHLRSKTAAPPAIVATTRTGGSPEPPSRTEAAPVLTQQQLAAAIIEQGVTPERAKQLFSMVVGPLPGVDVPATGRDPTDFDGTLAIGYIYKVWDALTPEQREAAAKLVHRSGDVSRDRVSTASFFPSLNPARFIKVAQKQAYDYQTLAQNAALTLEAFLAVPPMQFTVTVDFNPPIGTEYAHSWLWYKSPERPNAPDVAYLSGCEITIHDQKFQPLNDSDAEAVVTHEMFHCYQYREAESEVAYVSVPAWIAEGEPTWAMAAVVSAADAVIMGNKWSPYVNGPTTVYVNRWYDAIGVFGHLGDVAGDQAVWPKLLPILKIGIGGNSADAFNALVQGNQIQYFTSWGSSYFLTSGHTPWTMVGPGSPPTTGPTPTVVSLDSQTDELLTAESDQSAVYQLSGSADIVMVTLMTGYGRLHDQNFGLDTALDASGPLALCLKDGGCKCPDGTAGASLFTQQATPPLSLGINGGDTRTQVGVVTNSLDHFCKQKQKPKTAQQPAPGGGGGGGGGDDNKQPKPPSPEGGTSWGDTHLVTLDGLAYNFQVVGEYTLVRSTKDDFLVQVRQVPVLGPKVASVNQAVATRIGGQRVTFTMLNGTAVMRVDGKVVSGELAQLKAGSLTGATTAYGGTRQLTWPDGTVMRVEQLGRYALNVTITPAASRRGSLEGLLGDFDGSPENDLIGKNNVKLGRSFTREDINGSLAEAWRVSPATSLFDYGPGQSTATFIDPTFPAKNLDVAGLANRETAEKTCREDGITDQRLLDDCILDLAATGEFIFGSRYAHAQQVLAARAALNAPAGAAPKLATLWVSGEILDSTSEPEFHFNANKGDVIWVYDPDCTDRAGEQFHPVFLWLFDPSGQRVGVGPGCQFGRVELLATGSYTFKGVFKYRGEINRYRIPIRFVRPVRRQQVSYGQMVSGTIEQRAAWDIYTWTGKEGDIIAVEGEGCDLGSMLTSILDPEGHDLLGPMCRKGNYFKLPKDGTYQLVVNSWNAAQPGPYHFVFQGGKLAN
jgi:hypothetical protein